MNNISTANLPEPPDFLPKTETDILISETMLLMGIRDHINVIYDVGASDNSIFMNFVGDVHYFEPTERIKSLEAKVIEANNNVSIFACPFGLSDKTEVNKLVDWETGGVFLDSEGNIKYGHNAIKTMSVISANDYMTLNGHTAVDFIKIDTEGHELPVMKGFGYRLAYVKAIQFEYNEVNFKIDVGLNDIATYLNKFGFYDFFYLTADGIKKIDLDNFKEHYSYCNIVCFKKELLNKAPEDSFSKICKSLKSHIQ